MQGSTHSSRDLVTPCFSGEYLAVAYVHFRAPTQPHHSQLAFPWPSRISPSAPNLVATSTRFTTPYILQFNHLFHLRLLSYTLYSHAFLHCCHRRLLSCHLCCGPPVARHCCSRCSPRRRQRRRWQHWYRYGRRSHRTSPKCRQRRRGQHWYWYSCRSHPTSQNPQPSHL
ncbi:hypothetical protein FIBSPDRAFT_933376 [Athelia psychrophila]|uniref:Uncharacterized protein n=1 Tax=Athelia psychrophila TaxID=1759441 RepID=A0A166H964_9AGAM|nr:hypothetical protein FIBSPDRAFT_933376 [Fibularhizoctonia sp. CBS 109695]